MSILSVMNNPNREGVDVSKWKAFKLIDLFELCLAKGDIQAKKMDEGKIPLISAGMTNNGIVAYIREGDGISEIFHGNCLTIDMFGKCFYQKQDFYAVSHGRINILKPKFKLTPNIGLFLIAIFDKAFEGKFSFSVMCSQAKLKNLQIVLPANEMNDPDWEYMESYISNLERTIKTSVNALLNAMHNSIGGGGLAKIDKSSWKSFKIGTLFSIERPKARSVLNYEAGDIPFVASGTFNNGVEKFVTPKDEELDKGRCITLSPVDGYAFYQETDFLGRGGAGSSILILRNSKLDRYNALHICTVIKKICSKYNYSNMCSAAKLKEEMILLPANGDGTPDWKYMSEYTKKLYSNIHSLVV